MNEKNITVNIDRLKETHPDWHTILEQADHADVVAYYEISNAAMSGNDRAIHAIRAVFPGVKNSVADLYAIFAACGDLMTYREIERSSNTAEKILDTIAHAGAAGADVGARLIDRSLPVIRTLRCRAGLTQQALADAAGLNIRQVQKLEYGEAAVENLSLKNALALANALGVTPAELIS